MKKGQVTIYLILGIIIISIVGGIIIFKDKFTSIRSEEETSQEIALNSNIEPIYDYLKECSRVTLITALIENSNRGGYYDPPTTSSSSGIPYYSINNKYLFPETKTYEDEISKYINANYDNCIGDLKEIFPNYKIETKEPKTKTSINKESISIDIKYPTIITYNNKNYEIEKISTDEDLNFNKYIELSQYITKELTKDSICPTCLAKKAKENKVRINLDEKQDETIVNIIDENFTENTYIFSFGIK